jgi:hypothetical protein
LISCHSSTVAHASSAQKGTTVDPSFLDDSTMMAFVFCTLVAAQDGGYESIHHVGIMGSNSISESMAKARKGKDRIHGLFPSIIWVA